MRTIPGVVVGIVKDLNDTSGHGRIKVEFPWLGGQRSAWAPIAVSLAGKRRGAFFMPEVDDEALVAFEQGDFDHPFIIGFLWNGVDKPPDDGIDTKVRRLRTVSGHIVEFDDRAGQERILIQSKDNSGHQIEWKDTPPGHVKIRTRGGQEIKLLDVPAGITMQTTGGIQITVSDAPPSVTISAPSAQMNVNCLQANLTAGSLLNVNAPMTIFNGVVQTPTLIAQAVVGAAYTPAPGNTFGL